jgi:hypothetical protein
MHIFNYDGNIKEEQEKLSKFLGISVDLVSGWHKEYVNEMGEYRT